jgi:ubiquinone/menaquinone biosynthesis C-methylase UbiE
MPEPEAWTRTELPETWVDRMSIVTARGLWTYVTGPFRSFFKRPRPVDLPKGMPGLARLPAYLLQEFHGMPNGYYSRHMALAYARGFEVVMLGRMRELRERVAERLAGCRSVLDVGCGAGRLTEAVRARGVRDVWGVDPCPYALAVAASNVPGARFAQGLAEATGFADQRFDGIGACFVLHELPTSVLDESLDEFARLLRPGGTLVVAEPSALHLRSGWLTVARRHGLRGTYYKGLARLVFEPFLDDWLKFDLPGALVKRGFRVESDRMGVPFREVVATARG